MTPAAAVRPVRLQKAFPGWLVLLCLALWLAALAWARWLTLPDDCLLYTSPSPRD